MCILEGSRFILRNERGGNNNVPIIVQLLKVFYLLLKYLDLYKESSPFSELFPHYVVEVGHDVINRDLFEKNRAK